MTESKKTYENIVDEIKDSEAAGLLEWSQDVMIHGVRLFKITAFIEQLVGENTALASEFFASGYMCAIAHVIAMVHRQEQADAANTAGAILDGFKATIGHIEEIIDDE